jgi:hypothetical protein
VLPTEFDQEAFARIVAGEQPEEGHLITKAYKYFTKRIAELVRDEAEGDEDYTEVTAAMSFHKSRLPFS